MTRRASVLLLLLCLCCTPAHAQKWWSGFFKSSVETTLEKELPKTVRQMVLTQKPAPPFKPIRYAHDNDRIFLQSEAYRNAIPSHVRTVTAEQVKLNEEIAHRFLMRNARTFARVRRDLREIAPGIRTVVSREKMDYEQLFGEAKFIFLGDIHHYAASRNEIFSIVSDYKRNHPNERILLASEFAFDVNHHNQPVKALGKPVTQAQLNAIKDYLPQFVQTLKEGVDLLGLESNKTYTDISISNDDHLFYCSFLGIKERNEYWAGRLKKAAPGYDRVFVYAGLDHLTYTFPHNLPSLMGTKTSRLLAFNHGVYSQKNTAALDNYLWRLFALPPHIPAGYRLTRYTTDHNVALLLGSDALINLPILPK